MFIPFIHTLLDLLHGKSARQIWLHRVLDYATYM